MNNDVKDETNHATRAGSPRRKRRTAEQARREILDAAKNRFLEEGPDGLRLKVIANDIGISHSSIIHHFGSRNGLLDALREDSFSALAQDLKKRLAESSHGDPTVDFFENVASTLSEQGYGRLLAWQFMAGRPPSRASIGTSVLGPDGSGGLLDGLSKLFHALRTQQAGERDQPLPDLDHTRAIVAMCACTLLGESIGGDVLVRSAGLGATPEDRRSFRAWFARQAEHMPFRDFAPASQVEDEPSAEEPASDPD